MNDRRKESRLVERNQVLIWPAIESDEGPAVNAFTYDVSTGGARLCSRQYYNVGTVVTLQVHLARSRQSITLEAEVRWYRVREDGEGYEFGVEFRHRMTGTLLALIRHLYNPEEGIPALGA